MRTLRLAQLSRLWGADDARIMRPVLDSLRDALWQTYGEDISQRRRAEPQPRQQAVQDAQLDLWDDDNNRR